MADVDRASQRSQQAERSQAERSQAERSQAERSQAERSVWADERGLAPVAVVLAVVLVVGIFAVGGLAFMSASSEKLCDEANRVATASIAGGSGPRGQGRCTEAGPTAGPDGAGGDSDSGATGGDGSGDPSVGGNGQALLESDRPIGSSWFDPATGESCIETTGGARCFAPRDGCMLGGPQLCAEAARQSWMLGNQDQIVDPNAGPGPGLRQEIRDLYADASEQISDATNRLLADAEAQCGSGLLGLRCQISVGTAGIVVDVVGGTIDAAATIIGAVDTLVFEPEVREAAGQRIAGAWEDFQEDPGGTTLAAGGAVVGAVRNAAVVVGEKCATGPSACIRAGGGALAEILPTSRVKTAGNLMEAAVAAAPRISVRSRIGDNPFAVRQAERLSDQAQRDVDSLLASFKEGNLNPGLGTRALGDGFFELRGRNGGRVIVKQRPDAGYDIVGKFQGHVRGNNGNSDIIKRFMRDYRAD